jgi:hypothetical protein
LSGWRGNRAAQAQLEASDRIAAAEYLQRYLAQR